LELGDKIVSALNLHKTVDTLGRWKAHHLAELVLAVRDAKGPDKVAAEAKLANLLQNFSRPSRSQFHYSGGYNLNNVMPILKEILRKH
jgi:2'-5' RNA ligase